MQSSLCNWGHSLLWWSSLQGEEGKRNLRGQDKSSCNWEVAAFFFLQLLSVRKRLILRVQEVKLGTALIPSQAYYELLNVRTRAARYFKSWVEPRLLISTRYCILFQRQYVKHEKLLFSLWSGNTQVFCLNVSWWSKPWLTRCNNETICVSLVS